MNKPFLFPILLLSVLILSFASCKEEDDTYDPYADWSSRNAQYFEQIASQARDSIAQAKRTYGDQWEDHCNWRMYKTATKAPNIAGALTDSVCVYIEQRGQGTTCPLWTDTVRVNYRGYLMPTQNIVNGQWVEEQTVFSQSYMGELNQEIAVPAEMCVSSAVAGFATALLYMHQDDIWWIYIPSDLAYGSTDSGTVPAYSTLTFYTNLVAIYTVGDEIPEWKQTLPY